LRELALPEPVYTELKERMFQMLEARLNEGGWLRLGNYSIPTEKVGSEYWVEAETMRKVLEKIRSDKGSG
jgi:hypothetical protein